MSLAPIVRPLAAAFLLVVSLAHPTQAQPAPRHDALYVFGDSLADVGNVWRTAQLLGITPAPPPSTSPNLTYFRGRFSNGPVAVEYLWQRLSGHAPGSAGGLRPWITNPIATTAALDFAFGGTGTPDMDQTPGGLYAPGLKGQVELFRVAMAGRTPSRRALYVISTGANDYRADAYNVPMAPQAVVANIAESITRLYRLGAREFVILTLPDLGALPYLSPEQRAQGSAVTAGHNALLAQAVAGLRTQLSKATLRLVDANVVFTDLRGRMNADVPALDTLLLPIDATTPMSACLFVDVTACRDVPDGVFDVGGLFLFWDVVHPTTDAHRALADYMYEQLR
ncbi:hypothetical protein TBR22_A06700 [Luteitalea sp. TBR-22]|uniref:SGNH/GDSL hydrolase family protein n=1 Tax=Luteitalea sp. TBR-22 TaxID=2802971 RepID=UPI001AF8D562|nr:SGNH/GDSL hydrolase family protein [Luteitalea sp. TBR-22]BCS31469.1 hypothetical protein TBR22_A06700 [Luteitalea sp. TBR-22]